MISLFLASAATSFAQQEVLKGVIFDQGGAVRIGSASVMNLRSGDKTISNDLGLFSIKAEISDTLKISRTGYSDNLQIVRSKADLIIKLQRQIQLSEVQVLGKTTKQELDEVKEQYQKKGSFYSGKPPVLAYLFTPLTALYELVGKTPNQARRFNAYYTREMLEVEIDRRFNASRITSVTGLVGEDLKNFIFMYRPGHQLISDMDDYALTLYIMKSFDSFNKAGRPKGLLSLPALPKAKDLSEKIKF